MDHADVSAGHPGSPLTPRIPNEHLYHIQRLHSDPQPQYHPHQHPQQQQQQQSLGTIYNHEGDQSLQDNVLPFDIQMSFASTSSASSTSSSSISAGPLSFSTTGLKRENVASPPPTSSSPACSSLELYPSHHPLLHLQDYQQQQHQLLHDEQQQQQHHKHEQRQPRQACSPGSIAAEDSAFLAMDLFTQQELDFSSEVIESTPVSAPLDFGDFTSLDDNPFLGGQASSCSPEDQHSQQSMEGLSISIPLTPGGIKIDPTESPTRSGSSSSASSGPSSPSSPLYDDVATPVVACASCKRSHIKCDHGRPCLNCLKHPSKAMTCRDAVPKPRGRPKGGSKVAAEALMMAKRQHHPHLHAFHPSHQPSYQHRPSLSHYPPHPQYLRQRAMSFPQLQFPQPLGGGHRGNSVGAGHAFHTAGHPQPLVQQQPSIQVQYSMAPPPPPLPLQHQQPPQDMFHQRTMSYPPTQHQQQHPSFQSALEGSSTLNVSGGMVGAVPEFYPPGHPLAASLSSSSPRQSSASSESSSSSVYSSSHVPISQPTFVPISFQSCSSLTSPQPDPMTASTSASPMGLSHSPGSWTTAQRGQLKNNPAPAPLYTHSDLPVEQHDHNRSQQQHDQQHQHHHSQSGNGNNSNKHNNQLALERFNQLQLQLQYEQHQQRQLQLHELQVQQSRHRRPSFQEGMAATGVIPASNPVFFSLSGSSLSSGASSTSSSPLPSSSSALHAQFLQQQQHHQQHVLMHQQPYHQSHPPHHQQQQIHHVPVYQPHQQHQ